MKITQFYTILTEKDLSVLRFYTYVYMYMYI